MSELWKPINGYEGWYEVSSLGRVRSLDRIVTWKGKEIERDGKMLVPLLNYLGYQFVHLSMNGKTKSPKVHRLVADAFVPNPHNRKEINHKNGIKTDNRAENLEWSTRSENIKHSYDTGLRNGNKIKKVMEKPVICHETGKVYESASLAAIDLDIPWYSVARVARGDRPKTHGYTFSYLPKV